MVILFSLLVLIVTLEQESEQDIFLISRIGVYFIKKYPIKFDLSLTQPVSHNQCSLFLHYQPINLFSLLFCHFIFIDLFTYLLLFLNIRNNVYFFFHFLVVPAWYKHFFFFFVKMIKKKKDVCVVEKKVTFCVIIYIVLPFLWNRNLVSLLQKKREPMDILYPAMWNQYSAW